MATADAVICGAGIAGAAAAHELAVRRGLRDVLVVDPLPPLSLTSDKSTECYRNWWPGPGDAMVRLMNRSIDLLEELETSSGGRLHLNRRGYAYATARRSCAAGLERSAREIAALGAGELRVHRGAAGDPPYRPRAARGFDPALTGADLLLDRASLRVHFPFLADDVVAVLHARRCGWLSAQQLGMVLLERARVAGVRLVRGRVGAIRTHRGKVSGVEIEGASGREQVATACVVDAAGPHARQVGALAGVDLPLANELHGMVTFDDYLRVVPRDAPLMIWCDPVELRWTEEERRELEGDPGLAWLLAPLPAGAHFRTEGAEGSTRLLLLWGYHSEPCEPTFPPRFDPLYPEVVVRGLSRMVPALGAYFEGAMHRPFVDGGYYCKTRENRLLVGPTPIAGFHVLCGLSGYGIMAALGAAELLASYGFGKAKDLLAWWIVTEAGTADPKLRRYFEVSERARERYGIRLRPVNMKDFSAEVARCFRLYNAIFERNWGFVPVGEAEFAAIAHDLRSVVDPSLVLFAEDRAGAPIGFAVCLPDINEVMPRNGRLFPFGWWRLLTGRRKIRAARLFALGVVPAWRRKGVEALLAIQVALRAKERGIRGGETSWTLEDNVLVNRMIEALGARLDRRYRLYGLDLR